MTISSTSHESISAVWVRSWKSNGETATEFARQGGFTPSALRYVEQARDALSGQREVDLDREAFPGAGIDDVERTNAPAVREVVVHEVHRPAVVGARRQCAGPSGSFWPMAP